MEHYCACQILIKQYNFVLLMRLHNQISLMSLLALICCVITQRLMKLSAEYGTTYDIYWTIVQLCQ